MHLHNVTLVVPLSDFLALLTLATDGSAADGLGVRPCMDGQTLQLAAQLSGSISQVVLAPGQNLSSLWRAVQLSGYTGWGVNATQLVVRPQAAVPDALVAACVPVTGSSSNGEGSSDGLSGGAIAGIVVGSVVGGALLLAAALLLLRRRRDSRCGSLRTSSAHCSRQRSPLPVPLPCVCRHAHELAHKVSLGVSTDPGTSFGPAAKAAGAAANASTTGILTTGSAAAGGRAPGGGERRRAHALAQAAIKRPGRRSSDAVAAVAAGAGGAAAARAHRHGGPGCAGGRGRRRPGIAGMVLAWLRLLCTRLVRAAHVVRWRA